jgi:WD40 repeat protein
VRHLAFSHDGHILAVLRADGLIELRLTMTGSKLASLQAGERGVVAVAFSENGELLGYFVHNGTVHGIDLQRELVRSS